MVAGLLPHIRIELLVPRTEQGCGQVESFAVQTELEHLRAAIDALALDVSSLRLDIHLLVLQDLDAELLGDAAAKPKLAGQLGVLGVGHIVLPEVTVQPIGQVQVLVIHGHQDVCISQSVLF